MPLSLHKFLIPTFILNSTLLFPSLCFMVLVLLKGVQKTMSAKSAFPSLSPITPLSRRMIIQIMLTLKNGRTVQKHQDVFDNRHMVSHPIDLLVQFDCHINLEACGSIRAVKYIHKYIYKGPDHAIIQTEGHDEICSYLDARYISSIQACHSIFKFPMHMESPAIYHLPVHLPGQQSVVFHAEAQIDNVVNNTKDIELLGWFKANQDPDLIAAGAHNYFYQEFPKNFVWEKHHAIWKVHQQYKAIGCMYSIPSSASKAFYLCLLLTVIKGKIYYCECK